jgi:hypothetical protein
VSDATVVGDLKEYIGHLHRRSVADALEIERLRALVVKYEALAATAMGTLEAPPESTEAPWTVTHNVPGNAPT